MGDEAVITATCRQFPSFGRPWRSDAGRYYATRTGAARTPPRPHVPFAWAMTVDGDDEDDLRRELDRQERIAC